MPTKKKPKKRKKPTAKASAAYRKLEMQLSDVNKQIKKLRDEFYFCA